MVDVTTGTSWLDREHVMGLNSCASCGCNWLRLCYTPLSIYKQARFPTVMCRFKKGSIFQQGGKPTFRGKSVTITLLLLSNSISIFWFSTMIISFIFLSSFARPWHILPSYAITEGYGSTPMYGGSIVFVCVCVHHIYRSGPNLTTSIRSVVSLFQKGTTTVQEYNLQYVVDEQRQTTLNIIRAFPPPSFTKHSNY